MPKQILVPITGSGHDAAALETAVALARGFSAHLTFLHARPDPAAALLAVTGFDGGASAAGLYDAVEASGAEGEARARAAFDAFRDAHHLPEDTGEFVCALGDEAGLLAEHGRTAELLVTGRARGDTPVAMGLLESVLFSTGRPLLLVPAAPMTMPEVVAIAWKPAAEAARAAAAVLPFIPGARRVEVLTVEEDPERPDRSGPRLVETLRRHNPHVALRVLPPAGKAVDTLLSAAVDAGAGLLAMGAYGHGRAREFVFGGFTRQVLTGAPMAVLMMH